MYTFKKYLLLILLPFVVMGFMSGCYKDFLEIKEEVNMVFPPDEYETCDQDIAFQWAPVEYAEGYELIVNGKVMYEVEAGESLTVNLIPALPYSTTPYKWYVRAKNHFQYQPGQERTLFINDCIPPTINIVSPDNMMTIFGDWPVAGVSQDNVGVVKTEVYIDGTLSAEYESGGSLNYTINSYDMKLGVHNLTVKVYDAAGLEGVSEISFVIDILPPPPVTPGTKCTEEECPDKWIDLTATTYVCDKHYPRINWGSAMGATSYQFQVATSSDFSEDSILVDKSEIRKVYWDALEEEYYFENNTSYADPMVSDEFYYWRVRGVNNIGETSEWSYTYAFVVNVLDIPVLAFPTDAYQTANTNQTLEWYKVDGANSYHIQMGKFLDTDTSGNLIIAKAGMQEDLNIETNEFTPYESLEVEECMASDVGVIPECSCTQEEVDGGVPDCTAVGDPKIGSPKNTKYHWRVRARADSCDGPWSDIWYFELSSILKPFVKSPDPCGSVFCTPPNFEWTTIAGAISYMYQLADPDDNIPPTADDNVIFQTTYTQHSGCPAVTHPFGDQGFVLATSGAASAGCNATGCWYAPDLNCLNPPPYNKLPSGMYFFRVKASDGTFWTDWSDTCYFEIQAGVDNPVTPSSPATGFKTCQSGGHDIESLQWSQAPSEADGYKVYMKSSTAGAGTWDILNAVNVTDYTHNYFDFQDEGITLPYGSYVWKVIPFSGPCVGPDSAQMNLIVRTLDDSPDLVAPVDPTICDIQPTFEWEDFGVKATNYKLQITTTGSFPDPAFGTISTGATPSYTPGAPLATGTEHKWRVLAENDTVKETGGLCNSIWSSEATFEIELITEVPAVSMVPDGTQDCDGEAITKTFEWDTVGAATKYHLQISTDSLFGSVDFEDDEIDDTTYCGSGTCSYDHEFANSGSFFWRVIGLNDTCDADWTTTPATVKDFEIGIVKDLKHKNSCTPPITENGDPADGSLICWDGTGTQATIKWIIPSGSDHDAIHVQIAKNPASFADTCGACEIDDDSVGDTETSYDVTGLTDLDNTTYYWRVRAEGTCDGNWTDHKSFRLNSFGNITALKPDPSECYENDDIKTPTTTFKWELDQGEPTHWHFELFSNTCLVLNKDLSNPAGPGETCGMVQSGTVAYGPTGSMGTYSCNMQGATRTAFNASYCNFPSPTRSGNTYTFESSANITAGKTYYWRVRPFMDDDTECTGSTCEGEWSNGATPMSTTGWFTFDVEEDPKPSIITPKKIDESSGDPTVYDVQLCSNESPDAIYQWNTGQNGCADQFQALIFDDGVKDDWTEAHAKFATVPVAYSGVGGPWEGIQTFTKAAGDFTDGKWYPWMVRGIDLDTNCYSSWTTGSMRYKNLAIPTLNTPAADTVICDDSSYSFTWNAVEGASKYYFNYCTASGCTELSRIVDVDENTDPVHDATSISVSASGWNDNGEYYWRVAAANNGLIGGNDCYSSFTSVRKFISGKVSDPIIFSPVTPIDNKATGGSFEVSFNYSSTPVYQFSLRYSVNEDMSGAVPMFTNTTVTNPVFDFPSAGTYYWQIKAIGEKGGCESPWSEAFQLNITN